MLTTRFTALVGCAIPIQQAGMGGVAMPPLVRAVTAAGGLGMLGAAGLSTSTLTEMLDDLREQTTGPFGVNFLMPFLDRDCVEVAAARARVVEFFYGEPDKALVDLVHSGGALACWQVGSQREAVAAVEAGCDLIVAQGVEAGGHVRGSLGLLPLLDAVLGSVAVPVIAAGGIGTGRAMAAALAAGADAVRVGTRLVAAEEADAHPAYVRALIAAQPEDTVLTETFSIGWPDAPHRVLRACVTAAAAFEGETVGSQARGGERWSVGHFASTSITRDTTGALEAMPHWAGQSVGAVTCVQPAADIVRELAEQAEALLRRPMSAPVAV
jgi:NAD(P)H-dependent flavin oxidoreductase YrpB (nitropropane dioxygenase family)